MAEFIDNEGLQQYDKELSLRLMQCTSPILITQFYLRLGKSFRLVIPNMAFLKEYNPKLVLMRYGKNRRKNSKKSKKWITCCRLKKKDGSGYITLPIEDAYIHGKAEYSSEENKYVYEETASIVKENGDMNVSLYFDLSKFMDQFIKLPDHFLKSINLNKRSIGTCAYAFAIRFDNPDYKRYEHSNKQVPLYLLSEKTIFDICWTRQEGYSIIIK